MVCPHDTVKNPDNWFFFAQQIGKLSKQVISFQPSMDFKDFHHKMAYADLIYANPQDSLSLYCDYGYIPLARPQGLYDEVVFIANKKLKGKGLAQLNNQKIASVTSMIPTALAIKHLHAKNITPRIIENRDSWLAVMRAVYTGDCPFGFVYQDFYKSLGNLSKSSVNFIEATLSKTLYHMMLLHPKHKQIANQLQDILFNLHNNPALKAMLQELNINRFIQINPTTMEIIKKIEAIKLKD